MTLGYVQREMRALEERVKALEGATDAGQITSAEQRANAYTDQAFKRLVIWVIAAALLGSGVMLALSKL